jgi:hypothetical protein
VTHLSILAFLASSGFGGLGREGMQMSLFLNNNEAEGRKEAHALTENRRQESKVPAELSKQM